MLAPLILALIGFVVWKLWAPAMAWVPSFARLLDRPVRQSGLWPFMVGLETAAGDFDGRPVLLALHHKRGRNSLGYLVVAMQPRREVNREPGALGLLPTPEARAALDQLRGSDGLNVSFDDGWVKSRWQPGGFMIFPGRFEAPRWRGVLEAMSVVAASLEADPA